MKKRELMIICGVVAVVLQITAICHAVPVFVDTVAADFDSLLGGLAYALDDEMISDFSGGNLLATIISQSFTDGACSFLYLYQLNSTGSVDTEVISVRL